MKMPLGEGTDAAYQALRFAVHKRKVTRPRFHILMKGIIMSKDDDINKYIRFYHAVAGPEFGAPASPSLHSQEGGRGLKSQLTPRVIQDFISANCGHENREHGYDYCSACVDYLLEARIAEQTSPTEEYQQGMLRAAERAEVFAEGIASQNDVESPVENWSDFHKGQRFGLLELSVSLRREAERKPNE